MAFLNETHIYYSCPDVFCNLCHVGHFKNLFKKVLSLNGCTVWNVLRCCNIFVVFSQFMQNKEEDPRRK